MNAAKEMELNGFLAVLKANPGDATAVGAAADFIEENELMPWREREDSDNFTAAPKVLAVLAALRKTASRLPKA